MQMEDVDFLRGMWLIQSYITGEEEKLHPNPTASSELGPWWHPGLPRDLVEDCVGVTVLRLGLG